MNFQELLDRCERRDREAWKEFWDLVKGAVSGPVQCLVRCWHMDLSSADDVLQELFLYLQADNFRRLRAFRGNTAPELTCFLRTIAIRFSRKKLRRWQRTRQEETAVFRLLPSPDRNGPTKNQVEAVLRELLEIMPEPDWVRLYQVSSCPELMAKIKTRKASMTQPPAARTVRHWRRELYHKFGGAVG